MGGFMNGGDRSLLKTASFFVCVAALAGLQSIAASAQQKPEKSNMDLVGYNDLQAGVPINPSSISKEIDGSPM